MSIHVSDTWRIPLADVDLGPDEEAAVLGVLRRGWLTMGEETAAFEAEFARLTGARHAIAVANGTAALHLAGLALGWGQGDEVIVPSLTFVATANAVHYTGATPAFADIVNENDLGLSVADVARRITPRTRAIIAVHYAGYPVAMRPILDLARQHGLDVVEDAAHAPGASYEGRALGTWGRVGCFSFFSNKNMTTGEGGMLTTNDDDMAARLRLLRSHGMTSLTWDRHKGHAWSYDVIASGYNYRIDELRSAIGRVQLTKLTANNERRRDLDGIYRRLIADAIPGITLPYSSFTGVSSYHLRPILLPEGVNRRRFMELMKAKGIQTSIHYPPVHRFTFYRQTAAGHTTLPVTESVAERQVTLPLFPGMAVADVEFIVEAAREALNDAGQETEGSLDKSKAVYAQMVN